MTEVPFRIEQDVPKVYPNLRFEPGDHGINADPTDALAQHPALSEFRNGNPNAHIWNEGLVRRIEETHPKIIAIDSLEFGAKFLNDKILPQPASSEAIWIGLPTTPERVNPEDKSVLVVNGDFPYVSEAFSISTNDSPEFQAIRRALSERQTEDELSYEQDSSTEAYAVLAAALLIDAALGVDITYKAKTKKQNVVSRRTLLKGLIGAGITASAVGKAVLAQDSIRKAGSATTEASKDRWMDVVGIVEPKVLKSKLLNLRTALLTLKTKDSIDALGLPSDIASSIIMGTGHSFDAEDFLHSDERAQTAIRDYMESLDPVLTQALAENPAITREEAIRKMTDLLAKTFVLKVEEPDHSSFGTPALQASVEKSTSVASEFTSPRVKAAMATFL